MFWMGRIRLRRGELSCLRFHFLLQSSARLIIRYRHNKYICLLRFLVSRKPKNISIPTQWNCTGGSEVTSRWWLHTKIVLFFILLPKMRATKIQKEIPQNTNKYSKFQLFQNFHKNSKNFGNQNIYHTARAKDSHECSSTQFCFRGISHFGPKSFLGVLSR